MYCSDIVLGDLVCVRSWNTDRDNFGWISVPSNYGIVLEVIEVEHDYVFINQRIRCYNYVIYWVVDQKIETLPDIIVEKFSNWQRRKNER